MAYNMFIGNKTEDLDMMSLKKTGDPPNIL